MIRNAGGVLSDDAIRSLAISQNLVGTEEIILIHHTDCGMLTFTDEELDEKLHQETGERPEWRAHAFADVEQDARDGIGAIIEPVHPQEGQRPRVCLRRKHGRTTRGQLSLLGGFAAGERPLQGLWGPKARPGFEIAPVSLPATIPGKVQ